MILQDYKINGDYISISKKELEEWRDHYWKVSGEYKDDEFRRAYYIGKQSNIVDILKMFEPLIGE